LKKPDIPHDEQARIETLRSLNVLDTLPEERFDRMTRMAKRMFDVPIALVSLVDENRQWFKSCIGLNVRETSRDISFCGHAILGGGAITIKNTTEDQRFADNPLVLDAPNIRFYAGCPLSLNGHKLGTLCIIDQKPRRFEKEDVEALQDLAAMVERELEAIQLATLDELTHISNRRGFMALAQHSLSLCARQRAFAALVFLDLDKFKSINDKYGHKEGDRALIAFASQMKTSFRSSDIFARLGGDEFVVLLTNASKPLAEEVIVKFSHSLNEFNQEANRGYALEFSYGIVESDPERQTTIDELLANGDALMYEVKRGKR